MNTKTKNILGHILILIPFDSTFRLCVCVLSVCVTVFCICVWVFWVCACVCVFWMCVCFLFRVCVFSVSCASPVSDAVRNLSCSGVSWDSVQLTWEPPTNPNGQILFYQIQVDSHTHSLTHQAPAPQYVVSGLHPDEEYTLTVTAVNSAGPGEQIN